MAGKQRATLNNEDDMANFENLVKKYLPEFVDITRIPSGPVANFAQGAMSNMLNNGVCPEGITPPFHDAFRMEIAHGRRQRSR